MVYNEDAQYTMKMHNNGIQWGCIIMVYNEDAQYTMKMQNIQWRCTLHNIQWRCKIMVYNEDAHQRHTIVTHNEDTQCINKA